ncbi:MAG TPA: HTTM domain-containing protein [Polyangiaceae bacterium]
MVVGRLIRALDRPVDAASASAFRALFGALMLLSTARFLRHGWVAEYYQKPKWFFSYWGFGWVHPLPGVGMYALYGVIAAASACVLLGLASRVASAVFALGFGYAHLCDKTNYLNHYYLITLLGGLFLALPLDREFSVRAWCRPRERRGHVRAWVLYLLRLQIGVVYAFGGIGKLGTDWLIHGEPLHIWLAANGELPVLGRVLLEPWAGLAFSWCGALFDLSIVPLLSFRATRAPAYLLLVVFHVLTALLFNIVMFPWVMIVSATIFWDPSWPRQLLRRLRCAGLAAPSDGVAGAPLSVASRVGAALYALLQLLLPLRSALYPGNTLWTEEGFRFSWKVMLIEKAGALELNVVDAAGRRYLVLPSDYLTPAQARMASTQPDMILQLAQLIARDFAARGHGSVRVYADSQVSFNGRRRRSLIDPKVDLVTERDTLLPKAFILPAPTEAPSF